METRIKNIGALIVALTMVFLFDGVYDCATCFVVFER